MGSQVKLITFLKKTSTGTQAVTGIGFKPRAIIFFWGGATGNASFRGGVWQGAGFVARSAADVITQHSTSWSSQDAQTSSNSSRRVTGKAISIGQYGEAIESEADITSLDSDGFTLDWTTASAVAMNISVLAIGGTSPTDAKVITWNAPAATGSQAVTGVGFKPDVLFTMRTNNNSGTVASGSFSFGMTDGTNSALAAVFDTDASAIMSTSRGQRTGQVVGNVDSSAAWANLASFTSFDTDGFTLNWSARTNTNLCVGLVIKGGSYKVGTTAKSTNTSTPVTQNVSGLGFRPAAIFNFSTFGGSLTGAGTNHAELAMGVGDGINSHGHICRAEDGSADSDTSAYWRSSKAMVKQSATANTVEAEGGIALHSSSFDWIWTTNDAVGSNLAWMAIGPLVPLATRAHVVAAA